jgi:hypothetical protein
MEAVSTFETSINFYQTTRRNNPEDRHLYTTFCFMLTKLDEIRVKNTYAQEHPHTLVARGDEKAISIIWRASELV